MNNNSGALVVTSIASPTEAMRKLAKGALQRSIRFYCIGDVASPVEFELEGCEFISLSEQKTLPFKYANVAPEKHYARKNIGYLKAISDGADLLLETDDDNAPDQGFWDLPLSEDLVQVEGEGWFNVYSWFGADAWPRGYPLEDVLSTNEGIRINSSPTMRIGVWQGLVAGEPDVDAVFRLTRKRKINFSQREPVILGRDVWSPFNSQNTHWAKQAFPLLYLPATCSFRATDIVRGYVALRCLWATEQSIAFTYPTAVQYRNVHDLMRDFCEEIPIYLHAGSIANRLTELELKTGEKSEVHNLFLCYEKLVEIGAVDQYELELLDAWCEDIAGLGLI